jgi:hypothetical protein
MIEIVESTIVSRVWAGHPLIPADIQLGEVQARADGGLSLSYGHIQEGSGSWKLDDDTLEPIETLAPSPERLPEDLARVESGVPGMQVRSMVGRGQGPNPELRYILRWETLCSNRDQPRETVPPPSELRVYTVRTRTLWRTRGCFSRSLAGRGLKTG